MRPVKATSPAATAVTDGVRRHVVREGESLYSISRLYGNIPVASLLRWNDLSEANYIKPGTALKILASDKDKKL